MSHHKDTIGAIKPATPRKAYQAREVANPWWLTEQGIKDHYHEQREEEIARHAAATKRINDEELAALAAFDKHMKDAKP